jgi:hypothetical protein
VLGGYQVAVPRRVSLNDAGSVAFAAVRFTGHQTGTAGIFRLDGDDVTKIAPFDNPSFFSTRWVDLANSGQVTYVAQFPGDSGVYAGDGTTIETIYSAGLSVSVARANESGATVFSGFSGSATNPYTMLLVDGPNSATIASGGSTDVPRFDFLGGPSISSAGRIIFVGGVRGEVAQTLFNYENGQVTRMFDVTQNGLKSVSGLPGLNELGQIVFSARTDTDLDGIFTGPDVVNDKVIQTGDVLDGRTVLDVGIYGDINESAQIAFRADFSDGLTGIYVATLVPEPAGWIPAVICLLAAGATRMRRWSTNRFEYGSRARSHR